MSDEFQQKYLEARAENERLSALIVELQRQLKQSLDGQEELRALLKDLQTKLDVLIAQSKKRNKKDYGTKTERHNPRPAATKGKQASDSSPKATDESDKATGIKHILDNAAFAHPPAGNGERQPESPRPYARDSLLSKVQTIHCHR